MTTPPRLSVGYSEQGILIYRQDEHNQPVMVAVMDCTAAIRYAATSPPAAST